jgi:hypothetical protein
MDLQIAKREPLTLLLKFSGLVSYSGEKRRRYFTESFLLTNDGSAWKVISDTFRFLDRPAFT